MMEVKQNTAVDLNELLAPQKSADVVDELDDAIMADLSDETSSQNLNCDLMKEKDKTNNGLLITNGDVALSALIDIDDDEEGAALDEDIPVTTEMEEALLAEDDVVLPDATSDEKLVDSTSPPSLGEDDDIMMADKVENSNSTSTSSTDRDPGDDLDTLLSKINDIVDECLEENTVSSAGTPAPELEEMAAQTNGVEEAGEEEAVHKTDCISLDDNVVLEEAPPSLVEDDIGQEDVGEKEKVEEKVDSESDPSPDLQLKTDADDSVKDDDTCLKEEPPAKEPVVELSVEEDVVKEDVVKEDVAKEDVPKEDVAKEDVAKQSKEISEKELPENENKTVNLDEDLDEVSTEKVIKESSKLEDSTQDNDASKDVEDEFSLLLGEGPETDAIPTDETEKSSLEAVEEDNQKDATKEELGEDTEITKKPSEETKAVEEKDKETKKDSEESDDEIVFYVDDKPDKPAINEENVEEANKVTEASKTEKSSEEESVKMNAEDDDVVVLDEKDTKTEKSSEEEKASKMEKSIEETNKFPAEDDDVVVLEDKEDKEENEGKEDKKDKDDKYTETKKTSEKVDERVKIPADDDDVVVLDDDDDDEVEKNTIESEKDAGKKNEIQAEISKPDVNKKTTSEDAIKEKENSPNHSNKLDLDNSDNARDDFATDKGLDNETQTKSNAAPSAVDSRRSSKTREIDETNSNCSSSSNLLLEAKTSEETSGDVAIPEDNENENDNEKEDDEEDDDNEVEVIENEIKESKISSEKGEELAPPAKRPRLSEDGQEVSSTVVDDVNNKSEIAAEEEDDVAGTITVATASDASSATISSTLKRSHDVIEIELDDKSNDSITKKARTERKSQDEAITIAEDTKEEKKISKVEATTETEDKPELKNIVPCYKPIPLYPPPKLESLKSEQAISLDFLKKFRKSFNKMTKQDLEEMVLQKVVEAIIHKSEFAEMRELIEKQEKLIQSHRTKITELSKQFRDLEMVHNRVVKDIEQRNSQFIMPVKITRAVGLQVYIPNKKSIMESGVITGNAIIPSASPQQRPTTSSSSAQSNLTSPQRLMPSSAAAASPHTPDGGPSRSAANTLSSGAVHPGGIPPPVRRGCAQKVTPIRPVPSISSNSSTPSSAVGNSAASVYRNTLNQTQTATQPRILNKSISQTSSPGAPGGGGGGGVNSPAGAGNMQRQRYHPASVDSNPRMQQQQSAPASRPISNNQRIAQQKPAAPPTTVVPRRPEPSASSSSTSGNNTPSLDNYMNTLSQLTGGNTAVSITPAKPKEKAVIDLTDEDEIAPAAPPAPANVANNTSSTSNGPPASHPPQRRSLPPPTNSGNSSQQFSRNTPPLARIPPINQMSNSNKARQVSTQGQKGSAYATPAGTSITRVNVSTGQQNNQRIKYSHPAPLPATPPQAFNPAWKLPPPRPTIRISNLDNGIVISWTMEEAMDRHAECVSYQIYAYQETSGPPTADSWRHVGDVKAMLLPMAVTLTQFQEGQRYFFAVRAVDCHQRYGPFSLPKTWS